MYLNFSNEIQDLPNDNHFEEDTFILEHPNLLHYLLFLDINLIDKILMILLYFIIKCLLKH